MKRQIFAIIPILIFTNPVYSNPTLNPFQVSEIQQNQLTFNELIRQCAPEIHPDTMQALVRTESNFNPFAIGVVKGNLKKQPQTLEEALLVVKELERQGKNFSMGLAQINKNNLSWLGLNYKTVFDSCTNLNAGAKVLSDCFFRAKGNDSQDSLRKALSCYYSGNFKFGFTQDFKGQASYVQKVIDSAKLNNDDVKILIPKIDSTVSIDSFTVRSTTKQRKSNLRPAMAEVKNEQLKTSKKRTQSWDVFAEF